VLEFLRVETTRMRLMEASIKQNNCDLRTLVENFQELERALEGSEYLAELYDCDN